MCTYAKCAYLLLLLICHYFYAKCVRVCPFYDSEQVYTVHFVRVPVG